MPNCIINNVKIRINENNEQNKINIQTIINEIIILFEKINITIKSIIKQTIKKVRFKSNIFIITKYKITITINRKNKTIKYGIR
jgi:hypothetical protein